MNRSAPIPTPWSLRWREFRIRGVPALVVGAAMVTCAWIWTHHVAPATVVGEVEVIRADITSHLPGTLAMLGVAQFQTVKAGDLVARVLTADPKLLESSLAVIKAEVELLRAGTDPVLNKERNLLDFERVRLDLIDQRVLLAGDQIRLRYAESELARVAALYREGSVTNVASRAELEIAQRDRDALEREIQERERQVEVIEANLRALPASNLTNALGTDPETLRAAIDLQEKSLRLTEAELAPLDLRSPVEGTVSMVYRHQGESVVAGEPIVTIVGSQSDRILGFVLPPASIEPAVGMSVEVRTRNGPRRVAQSTITHVGRYMDLVPATLLLPASSQMLGLSSRTIDNNNANQFVQVGIPFALKTPSSLALRPGERVDLTLVPSFEP
ncbi:MAG TPA: HlyD family efflux transporter periplasmic adaptor subunit [Verrucomicrobiota bacterium]|nr:HlyD family efflux transporter periplasmic adaptor subunit [Verrucomicrobiota bacterium]HNU51977.1 HlyD family efflux transporter periplasmic adaptor subunit [Verrucomicrobiota bacterium]